MTREEYFHDHLSDYYISDYGKAENNAVRNL